MRQNSLAAQISLDLTHNFVEVTRRAAGNALAYRARQTLMNELEALLDPQAPPSEPEVLTENVYVSEDEARSPNLGDRDFSVDAFMKKPRSWW